MHNTEVSSLNHTVQQTQEWLDRLVEEGSFESQQQAYTYFRATLHSLRDRLTAEEAVHFAAQLPMLVRGFYYEGWRVALAPNDEDTVPEFLDSVRESLRGDPPGDDALLEKVRAVFRLLNDELSEGQVRHVRFQLPKEVQEIWKLD